MDSWKRQSMATIAVALICFLSLVAARPLDDFSSRHLLQDNTCPPQMTQCFTSPYQAQYFCCDSTANLQCSGGPDFKCSNYVNSSAPLVPASLIPVIPGLETPSPSPTAKPATLSATDISPAPSPTNGPSNPSPTNASSSPSPTNPPSTPTPTNPPSTPAPTNPPSTSAPANPQDRSNPAPTTPPNNPAPTNPPNNPAPTNPPNTPAPTPNPPSGGGDGFRPGIATWYTDPNNANYLQTACYYNNPQSKPGNNMIVALPPHIFGAGPGAGNGPGCGTYWEIKCVGTLKRIADGLFGGNKAAACATGKSIIVKGGDLCPECDEPRNDVCQAEDQPYCPPGEHLDLALAAWQVIGNNPPVTGVIEILFRQVGPVPDSQLGVPF